MKTDLLIPHSQIRNVQAALKSSGVKFYPFLKQMDGYLTQIEPQDHPLVSYLILKYDINMREGDSYANVQAAR